MEEQNTDQAQPETPQTTPVPVMDIHSSPSSIVPAEPTVSELATPPQDGPTEQPTEQGPPTDQPAPAPESAAPTANPEHAQATPPVVKPAKKRPMMLIIIAVVVALVLIVAAVFAYMNRSKSKTDQTTTNTAVAPAAATQTTKVTSNDVSQVSKDVDTALSKADSSSDVSATDLTNTSLGL